MPHLEIIHHRPPTALGRFMQTLRSYTGPLSLKDPELARKLGWGSGPTAAGVSVNEATALNYAAVWQAVTLIAGDVGSLPLLFYKRVKGGGKERYTDHTLYSLLHDAPNSEMSSMVFRETLQAHLLTWGNAFAEIERDGAGRPVGLWPMLPNQVAPFRDRGILRYRVTTEDRREIVFEARDVLHVPGLGFDGVVGYSPIRQARESLGLLAATEKFGATFFGNGTSFGGALKHPKTLGAEGQKNLRASIDALHKGPERAHRFLILEEGMDYTRFGVEPNDAQFLETRQFQIAEVARWFNLPLHKLREMEHSSVRANIEQEALDYYTSTLRPWLTRWEQEINRKLVSPRERYIQFAEFLLEGVLRGDQKSRYDAYAIGRNWGWLNVNEIRSLENMNPIGEDGDVYLSPLSMVPINRVDEVIDKQVEPTPAPVAAPQEPAKDDEAAQAERSAFLAQMAEQAANIGALQARHEQALQDLASAVDSAEALRAERDSLTAAVTEALRERDAWRTTCQDSERQLYAEKAQVKAEGDAIIERQLAEIEGLRASAITLTEQASRDREAAEAAVRSGLLAVEALAASDADLVAARGAFSQQQEAHAAELAEVRGRLDVAETARLEAEAGTRVAAGAAEIAAAKTTEAQNAQAIAEQRAAEAEAARVTAVGALADARDQIAGTLAGLVTANRAVFVDAMSRLVRREAEKARSKRATPEKLRDWARSFYEAHEADVWVDALRPAVAMHQVLAGDGRDASEVARALVDAHFAVSQRQVLAVADADQSEYQAALTATLDRWETTRAAAVADDFVTKEIAYVRSIQ